MKRDDDWMAFDNEEYRIIKLALRNLMEDPGVTKSDHDVGKALLDSL